MKKLMMVAGLFAFYKMTQKEEETPPPTTVAHLDVVVTPIALSPKDNVTVATDPLINN